jgi:hypothetical protein
VQLPVESAGLPRFLDRSPISSASAGRHRLFAVASDEVRVYDETLQMISRFDAPGGYQVRSLGDRLVLVGSNGLEIYDFGDSSQGQLIGEYPFAPAVRLVPHTGSDGRPAVFAMAANGGGALFDLSQPDGIREIARYSSDPWFARSVGCGPLLARRSGSAPAVAVLARGGTTML